MARDTIRGDCRLQRRYPLELDLEYRIIKDDRVVAAGFGRTGNISSGGVLFHADGGAITGPSIELAVRWPAVLGNAPFLELCISGRLVRHDADGIALRMNKYHFQRLSDTRGAFEDLFTGAVIQ